MYEQAAQTITRYIENTLYEPEICWGKEMFAYRSCERWAAYEIIERILDHPFDPPTETVEMFLLEMTGFSYKNGAHKSIFEIARNTAEDILCIL